MDLSAEIVPPRLAEALADSPKFALTWQRQREGVWAQNEFHNRPPLRTLNGARVLIVGATGNIGIMPVDGGRFMPVIDFGDRATLIARQVAWAPDSASIYAAVADVNADIVLLDGLI